MSRKSRKKRGRKVVIFVIILVILLILFLSVGGYFIYKENEKKNRLGIEISSDIEVEVNSEVYLLSFVKDVVNGEIVTEDSLVDTSNLGNKKLSISIKNKKDEIEKYSFNIKVVDTEKPVVTYKEEITMYVGGDVDLLKDVTVSDNSGEEIDVTVVGEYDMNKEGKYSLKYVSEDASHNKGEYDFILNVVSDPNNRTFTTSKGFSGVVKNGVTYIDGVLIANKTYSLPSNYGSGLTSATTNAFNKMKEDALGLGLNLYISSGYRSYYDQKYIYNNYVKRDGQAAADTYSARAGHSEHQTGLAFDLNTINAAFANTEEGKWVADNCYKYGLIIRYPKGKESITGYIYESWHLRYVGVELATKLYNDGEWITLEEYYGIDSKYN